jgi:hypothetical protein
MNLEHSFKLYKFFRLGLRKVLVLVFLIFLIFNVLGLSQTKKVLFIGNSYTFVNNMPQITANIASNMGNELIFSSSAIDSYSLQLHSANSATLNLIRQGGWDYVVLQEYSQYPSEPLAWVEVNVYPYAQYLDNYINTYNSGAETMFYMTWGRKNGDAERCSRLPSVCTYIGMDDLTRERYMFMAQANQAVVSPVGAVWRYIRENYPSIELYQSDGSHPSPAGSYAAACCFYTALYMKDPGLITYNYTLDPADALKIRTATKMVVFNNLANWFIGTYIKYNITSSSGAGGTIEPSGIAKVTAGTNKTYSITPGTGYKVSNVLVDGVAVGAVSSYTFSNVTSNHTISASFVQITYTITGSAGTGGSINPSGTATVTHGTSRTYSITPATGYKISNVKVDNVAIGNVSTYTFSNITSNHSISASFAKLTYTLTSFAGTGGSVSPGGINTVDYGTSKTFLIKPNTGYYISDVKVDNLSVGPVSSYTFPNVTNNHSISALFSLQAFTITSETGSGGSVTPAGALTVAYGSNSTYSIVPDIGFLISDVKIDNISVGAISSYTFNNITSNHTLSAAFKYITFTIKSGSKSGGSISSPGTSTVNYGTDMVYSITPDVGFHIDDVMVDNKSIGPVSSYTFSNITGNHELSASFSVITYKITVTANTGGSVNPAGKTDVNYGSDLLLTFVPDFGYRIADVKVNNISLGAVTSYTLNNIKADQNISVTFNLIPTYSISVDAGEGGLVSPSGSVMLFEGSDQTYEIIPSHDYRILDVVVDNRSLGAVNEFTFSNIISNHTISVRFTTSIDVKAYPNPFAEKIDLYIASPEGYLFDLSIADLNGNIIYVQNKTPGNMVLPLNLAIPRGVYYLRIYLNRKKISIIKVVKS